MSVELLTPARVLCGSSAHSKNMVLEELARLLVQGAIAVSQEEVLNGLLARERLGSTGFGHGVAVPHARVAGAYRSRGACLITREGVDFDALDNESVDVFFALLVPTHHQREHLEILAQIAGLLSDSDLVSGLRGCRSDEALFLLLNERLNQA
ncbi:MAG: PTS sugar transporter subunit IIA [Gammaproteobacteria bacterium]